MIDLARTGRSIRAKVETVAGHVDPATRRRRVYLSPVGAAPEWLTPGMFVEARLGEPHGQLLLPTEAVLIKEGARRVVYIQKQDGRLYPRDVLVSSAIGGRVHVLKGVEPGDRVVTKGALLVDGRSEQLL